MSEKTGLYTVGVDWSAGVDWTVVEGIGADGVRVVFPLVYICENRDAEVDGWCCVGIPPNANVATVQNCTKNKKMGLNADDNGVHQRYD